jgi:hypothetical protein
MRFLVLQCNANGDCVQAKCLLTALKAEEEKGRKRQKLKAV